jgi:hypothetical protein
MVELGIVAQVTEPTDWVSPMVVVPKKSGGVRICVDFSRLNESVKRERYQLPTSEELFAKLQEAKYFSTLDAASGFWQIPLDDESSHLTTFLTPQGRFRFTRSPFEINSGPEVFYRVMSVILEGIPGVECYIDDTLVWGDSMETHDERLRQVLERCRQEGLRLNPGKCKLRISSVKYFGHCLTADGIHPDRDKLRALMDMKAPTTSKN